MIFYPNTKVCAYRGPSFATEVVANLDVYIYEQDDNQDAINGVEWGQNEQRLLTINWCLQIGDKLVTTDAKNFIVKKVKHRKSVMANFYELQIREQND